MKKKHFFFIIGYGGRDVSFLLKLFVTPTGALGHGDHKSWFTPKPVQFLRDKPKIKELHGK